MGLCKSLIHKTVVILICGLPLLFYVNCGAGNFHSTSINSPSANSAASDTPPVTNTPPPTQKQVEVLVAQGHMGRTVVSCDDGQSWIHDRSDDDNARCWVSGDPNYVECDHHSGAGRGIDFGAGYFYANFGHGAPSTLRRSSDGFNWTVIQNLPRSAGSVLYTLKRLILFFGQFSIDQGLTWQTSAPAPDVGFFANAKKLGSDLYVFGRASGIAISRDAGETWSQPATFRPEWGMGIENISRGGVAQGNGVIVILGWQENTYPAANFGFAARSIDGGLTWAGHQVFAEPLAYWNSLIFNGKEFVSWSNGKMWRSPDGENWTSTPILTGQVDGPVVMTSKGTYVSITSTWGAYYANQKAYRSLDGVASIFLCLLKKPITKAYGTMRRN